MRNACVVSQITKSHKLFMKMLSYTLLYKCRRKRTIASMRKKEIDDNVFFFTKSKIITFYWRNVYLEDSYSLMLS